LGIIVKEGLANGRLTQRNRDPGFERQMGLLQEEAQRLATSIDGLALAGVLAQPWVHTVLSGAARVDHLTSNLSALEVEWDDQTAKRLEALVETPAAYWSKRSTLRWN
jgi:aryl-alcohol dehydrogenase-like predicted oxidoreductase